MMERYRRLNVLAEDTQFRIASDEQLSRWKKFEGDSTVVDLMTFAALACSIGIVAGVVCGAL
jgi:hypothetical protein